MTDNRVIEWFVELEKSFIEKGLAGEDFFYLLSTMLIEGRISFLEMLSSAARGHGIRVHEGLEFALEEDLEDANDFDGVVFIIGEYESSVLPTTEFVGLLELLCRTYVRYFADDEGRVTTNLDRVRARYGVCR